MDVLSERRVGRLALGARFRGSDGAWWVEAECDCGSVTALRASHCSEGTRRPTLSCGCIQGISQRGCLLGRQVGDDLVVHDDGADSVLIECRRGHYFPVPRELVAHDRRGPSERRTRSRCALCGTSKTMDLTGQTFGFLTVLRRAGTDAPSSGQYHHQATWWCRCACGIEKAVRGSHLRNVTKTCGAQECIAAWRRVKG